MDYWWAWFLGGFMLATYIWHRQIKKFINWLINWVNRKSGNWDDDDED